MSKWSRIAIVVVCLFGFLFIRFRESALFYDPFILFFKGYFQSQRLPQINVPKLILNLILRYGIHMVLSIAVLWAIFMERGILKFSMILYILIFITLLSVFWYEVKHYEIGNYGLLFFVRRLLTQPVLIIILIPGFYYYRKENN